MNSTYDVPFIKTESYKNGLFAKIPIPDGNEKLILTGGIGPDLLVEPGITSTAIRRGKYQTLIRVHTGQRLISEEIACYCSDQYYQFHIRYTMPFRVNDQIAVWRGTSSEIEENIRIYVKEQADISAARFDMKQLHEFQSELNHNLCVQLEENGFLIGPCQNLHVEPAPEYRTFVGSLKKDQEKAQRVLASLQNANAVEQAAELTESAALMRDLMDGKLSADEMIQLKKNRSMDDFNRIKSMISDFDEMRRDGKIDEETYQQKLSKLLGEPSAVPVSRLDAGENTISDEFAPDQDDI